MIIKEKIKINGEDYILIKSDSKLKIKDSKGNIIDKAIDSWEFPKCYYETTIPTSTK